MEDEKKWKVLSEDVLFKTPFFSLKKESCLLPDRRKMPAYYVFDFIDWVNVVALTPSRQMIMVEQYRHATRGLYLEVPGGSMDPFNSETHKFTAERELLEETGYRPGELIYLGHHNPNPALQSNKMHTYFAKDCQKVADLNLDAYEDLTVVLMEVDTVYQKLDKGEIKHSLMIASLSLARDYICPKG